VDLCEPHANLGQQRLPDPPPVPGSEGLMMAKSPAWQRKEGKAQ